MRQSLAWLVMAVLVAVQFLDVAVVDAAAITTPTIHSESDHGQGKSSLDGCEIHCACHSLHHMAVCAPVGLQSDRASALPAAPRRHPSRYVTGEGPPVPPPEA